MNQETDWIHRLELTEADREFIAARRWADAQVVGRLLVTTADLDEEHAAILREAWMAQDVGPDPEVLS